MKILEELYFGNLDADVQHFDRNSEVAKAMDTLVEVEAKLTTMLDGKEKQLFLDFVNAWSVVNAETAFKRSEEVQENYIERHPLPDDDFFERLAIRTMAQMIGDEIAMEEVVLAK